jgi:hypothetical protein
MARARAGAVVTVRADVPAFVVAAAQRPPLLHAGEGPGAGGIGAARPLALKEGRRSARAFGA